MNDLKIQAFLEISQHFQHIRKHIGTIAREPFFVDQESPTVDMPDKPDSQRSVKGNFLQLQIGRLDQPSNTEPVIWSHGVPEGFLIQSNGEILLKLA